MLLGRIANAISTVQGVRAIALGGSRSRGEGGPQSDYDLGIYYDAGTLDVTGLAQRLRELDDGHRENLLNPPGHWGPWINGGAWLTVAGLPVDVLLRDIGRVEAVLAACIAGRITVDYQSGHPFGFVNTIYAAETHYARPLWQDEAAPLDGLKALLYSEGQYPPRMRAAVVRTFLWEAEFSLACGRKAAPKGDVHYAMGSLFRTVCSWVQVLYALNSRYLMNEKGALGPVGGVESRPPEMPPRVAEIYRLLAEGQAEEAYQRADALHGEVAGLASDVPPTAGAMR